MQMNTAVTRSQEAILQTNKVIRNTYILLSMTLIFSGFAALGHSEQETPDFLVRRFAIEDPAKDFLGLGFAHVRNS